MSCGCGKDGQCCGDEGFEATTVEVMPDGTVVEIDEYRMKYRVVKKDGVAKELQEKPKA